MLDSIEKLKGWLSLGVGPLLVLLFFTALISFLPDSTIESLSLTEIRSSYGKYFGLAFIFSVASLFAAVLTEIWKVFLGNWLREKATLYFYKKEAHDLTEDEKRILRTFINGKTRSTHLSIKDGTVLGLERRMFIIRVGQLGSDPVSWTFPFNIQPWAWEYFNKHPSLLEEEEDNA